MAEQLICNQQVAGSSPITSSNNIILSIRGWVPERPKGADCKSAVTDFDGSNPSPSTIFCSAGMAELADAHGSGPCVGDNMQVQVLFPAPNQYNPNLFSIGDGFGFIVFFDRYEATHFRNGLERKPTSKPRGPRKKKQTP